MTFKSPEAHQREGWALLSLTPYEARTVSAVFDRLLPADDHGPAATAIGAVNYLDKALAGPLRDLRDTYKLGLAALDGACRRRFGVRFAEADPSAQDELLTALEAGDLLDVQVPPAAAFFERLLGHMQEGVFSDPAHGGNLDKAGWRLLDHPGVHLANTAEENVSREPVDKRGDVRSLTDAGYRLDGPVGEPIEIEGFDPQAITGDPLDDVDVIIVGMGAVGGLVAPVLAGRGLRVVGFEAGPWRHKHDFIPDELTAAYYARGDMGHKFQQEAPRWRTDAGAPTVPASFSLGRMMNSVGGSVITWGGAVRRMHPHHFAYDSFVRDRWGSSALPNDATVADWPLSYDDLEPYYCRVESTVGVAGDESNPFVKRSRPLPLPPTRPFVKAELFRRATTELGLHPYPTPVAINTMEYNGLPATRYHAWAAGFGSFTNDRWNPSLTSVPEALRSGKLTLRTNTRVLKVLTDTSGCACGVQYVDANGNLRQQRARAVILSSYTFENLRLMFVSGDTARPEGLGNNSGQLGRHTALKLWADVYGHFPETHFNAHTGPASQMWGLDDYNAETFDSVAAGFVGGATLNIENQQLPLQIAKDPVPDGVPRWGAAYRKHLREWQHVAAVRIQPDSLTYAANFIDLDPVYRDRSGFGMPVVRITADLRENERRLIGWMQERSTEILRGMGATRTWTGPLFKGVCSSHDLGGTRMGENRAASVVDVDLEVHDTPGLFVYSGSVFPTCPGVNPTLTLWAVTLRAAERLATRLGS